MSTEPNEMMALLQRMQQQLGYLEKKLDTLIAASANRPQERPPFRGGKPFRPFRPHSGPGGPPRQGGYRPERPQGGGYGHKKKFYGRREH